ncbi:MAG: hypothetical protein GY820_27405 [Gammaproteobacteria bacterium]|nr:hypothetical protein [Gammaproteobacteria bacterium]
MALLPAQFADPALKQQLVSARKLDAGFQARPVLCSGITALDKLFAKVKAGDLIEWGIPPGLNGRLIPLQFLKQGIPASVWIYHHHGLGIFASSWISHGVDLRRLFFICSAEPVKDLRPLFLEDTFKHIIIDAPKKFSRGDLAFVAAQARKQGQIVFLIRHYFLSQKQGNAHACLRLNTWQEHKGLFSIQPIKGSRNGKINIPAVAFYDDA